MHPSMRNKIKASGHTQREKGFTLVELIVVLVILAILMGLLIPALTGYIRRAKEKQVIASGRHALVAAQALASEGYASAPWQEPVEEKVIELSEVKGQIVTMTFTNPGIVDTTEASPFRYKEGTIIAKFADGVWTIEEGSDSGDGDEEGGDGDEAGGDGDQAGGDGANPDGSVTLTDSTGNTYTISPTRSWSDIQAKIKSGWNIEKGCVLSDETGTYLCSSEKNEWIKNANANNWTVADLVAKTPGYFVKLNSQTKIYTEADILKDTRGNKWRVQPQKDELAYYNGRYYVASKTIGLSTFPPGGWVEIK